MQSHKFITAIIVLVFFSQITTGQTVGFYISPTQYNQNGGLVYNNVENRFSTDFGIFYKIHMSNNLNIQVDLVKTKRISEVDYSFSNCKVFEDFVEIPILLELSNKINDKSSFFASIGPNISTIFKQELLFPEDVNIPTDLKTEYGYSSYWKFGLIANIGIAHKITPRSSLFVSASSRHEFKDLSINKNNNPAFFYHTFSINLGWQFKLR